MSLTDIDEAYADEPTVALVTYQACTALSYLHSKGIVHRDIKPGVGRPHSQMSCLIKTSFQNILVTERQPLVIKLADFGLAKQLKTADSLKVRLDSNVLLRSD